MLFRSQSIADRLRLESDLSRALRENQISLVYQPLFDLQPFRLSGFEALARWTHPEMGPISPATFITLAEETGLMASLTPWVIETAAAQLASWRRMAPHLEHLGMHVNVSGKDLALPGFPGQVTNALRQSGLPASKMTLEITETSLMQRMDTAVDVMHGLDRKSTRLNSSHT